VGVNVRVGSAVSLGRSVGVCVGKIIGVTVDGSVGKGDGLDVTSGVIAVGGEIKRLNPPQLMRRQVIADIPTSTLLVIASLHTPSIAKSELWQQGKLVLHRTILIFRRLLRLRLAMTCFTGDDSNPRECAGPRV
jgi:hypothetical protein